MIFAITFRLEYDNDYHERWESLVEATRAQAAGRMTWEEPTSFFLLESSKTASEIAGAIFLGSKMHSTKDVLLVLNLSAKDQAVRGEAKFPAILSYLLGQR
jgi:hypothetical protein